MTPKRTDTAVSFFKMHGSGNDFVLLDNRELGLDSRVMPQWARALCKRAFSVGGDGLIVLEPPPADRTDVDYVWHFFNADGSRAEMCGNGSRCAARLAHMIGLAPRKHAFGSDAGPIKAKVDVVPGEVKVQLTPFHGLVLNKSLDLREHGRVTYHYVNTGVPHAVVITDDIENINLKSLGAGIRYHEEFAPAGTNVNVIQVQDTSHVLLRTYERGVEDETFACGTGAAAAVIVAQALEKCGTNVRVTTTGKEELGISLENGEVFLQGKAVLVYRGEVLLESVGLDSPADR